MAETMIRGKKRSFTSVFNSVIKDERLSLKTLGLFTMMQSFPEDWEYSVSGLSARARVGRDTIRKCLRELENAGYLLREQGHGSDGRFNGATFVLQEEAPPLTEKPSSVKPTSVKPMTENRPQDKKHLSKDIIPPIVPQGTARKKSKRGPKETADWKPDRFEAFWKFYRTNARGEDRQAAIRAWDKLRPDDDLIAVIGRALQRQVRSEDWTNNIGIPYASTYLNRRRWEDAPARRAVEPSSMPVMEEQEGVTYF